MPLQLHVGPPSSVSVEDQVRFIARAEALGFAGAGIAEDARYVDPYEVISAAIDATTDITLYPAVANPVTKTAVQHGRLISALSARAPGRIKLALGSGDVGLVALGKRPAKLNELKKAVVDVREMLGEGSLALFDHLPKGVPAALLPPPVMMAASGELTLQAAGEVADEVFVTSGLTTAARRAVTNAIAYGAAKANRRAREVPVTYHAMVSIDEDRRVAIERTRWWLHFLLERGIFRLSLSAMEMRLPHFSVPDSIPAALLERLANAFALAGTPAEVIGKVRRLEDQGVRTIFCMFSGGPKEHQRGLEIVAKHLIPVLGKGR